MDRRRYVPSAEGLEGRALQANLLGSSTNSLANNPATDVPVTAIQKQLRIDHLPYYLRQLQPGRYLPGPTIQALQTDIAAIKGVLHKPDPVTLENYNSLMQDLVPKASVSASDANALSHAFGVILSNAGATDKQVENLQSGMNDLVKVDSQSRQPTYLTTNDYSLVLQSILGIGRPIVRPEVPTIALKDGTRSEPGYGVSNVRKPTLVGTYGSGNTVGIYASDGTTGFNSKGVVMQLLDSNLNVVGEGKVIDANGDYRITVTNPLPNGVYTFYVRAVDPQGMQSIPSPAFHLKVASKEPMPEQSVPGGPLSV
ncbi:Ig-like domain-containing protein [Singulisphaera rosea]